MISIIIPTYNRSLLLNECIESVLSQCYEGLEIIIIDDFSSDSTKLLLLSLARKYPFIKFLINDANYGVNYSRNRGIKEASKDFILFLDSDDKLNQGSLYAILKSIDQYRKVDHFLFLVSYRKDEFFKSGTRKIYYCDWLNDSVSGDFTHVVRTSIMKQFLFFEQFRMFEYLNWLRIKRITSPQLLLPIVTTIVDRDREDSLSRASKLDNVSSIRNKFESQYLYYTLYYKDLKKVKSPALVTNLIYSVILGTAVNEKLKAREIIAFSQLSLLTLLGRFILYFPSQLILRGIIAYSIFKGQVLSFKHS